MADDRRQFRQLVDIHAGNGRKTAIPLLGHAVGTVPFGMSRRSPCADVPQAWATVPAVRCSAYRRTASSTARVASLRPSQPRLSLDLSGSMAS